MAEQSPFRDDPTYQAAWDELLRQVRAANADDAEFWAALGEDVAASDVAREALAETWAEAKGDWPTALPRYRWWMQDHAELFPTVNAIAIEIALANAAEKIPKDAAPKGSKGRKHPKTELH